MNSDDLLDLFYAQMEARPDERNRFLAWYFESILPTLPADCVRFDDLDNWAEADAIPYAIHQRN